MVAVAIQEPSSSGTFRVTTTVHFWTTLPIGSRDYEGLHDHVAGHVAYKDGRRRREKQSGCTHTLQWNRPRVSVYESKRKPGPEEL